MTKPKLAELHTHLGAAVEPHTMWSIAHNQGIKLPTKDYWEFKDILTVKKGEYKDFFEVNKQLFGLSELIQSSPIAVEKAVHATMGGAYRKGDIVLHELRFCPMKRNRGGERDLDHIIHAAIFGMERAMLEFPDIKAGLILSLDREFNSKENEIIYKKALKYKNKGVVGIDLGGPMMNDFKVEDLLDIFVDAKNNGLGVTIHAGEEGDSTEMEMLVDKVSPQRIGHGILAWNNPVLMEKMVEKNIYLELCPTSNLLIGRIKDYAEMKKIYRSLYEAGVKLTINTDGPEFYETTMKDEIKTLIDNDIFNEGEIEEFIKNSFDATFVK